MRNQPSFFPCFGVYMRLTQDAAKCAHRDFGLFGNDCSVDNITDASNKLT